MIGCCRKKMERLLVLFLPLLCSQALAASPLLIWNAHQARTKIPPIPALGSTSYASLWKNYLPAFPSENIILFMQDALRIEDLTSYPKENAKLNKLVSEGHHLYLPKVEETSSLQNDFKSAGYNILEVSNKLPLSELPLKKDSKNLVVIELPETLSIPQRNLAMQKTNEVIESALSKIDELAKFTIIFTANRTSMESHVSGSSNVNKRVARSLQQTSAKDPGFHNSTCALIYLRKDIVVNSYDTSGKLSKTYTLPNSKSKDEDTGDCPTDGSHSSVQITYLNVDDFAGPVQLEFKFGFTKNKKFSLLLVEGNLEPGKSSDLIFEMDKQQNEVVPQMMSYACSVKRLLKSNSTAGGLTYEMVLDGFQYEAFQASEGKPTFNTQKFDASWDCVGFFTVPIWMSLISVLIFLIILFWGMWMLADVKTMDRFDDPKGKSIVVPNTD